MRHTAASHSCAQIAVERLYPTIAASPPAIADARKSSASLTAMSGCSLACLCTETVRSNSVKPASAAGSKFVVGVLLHTAPTTLGYTFAWAFFATHNIAEPFSVRRATCERPP